MDKVNHIKGFISTAHQQVIAALPRIITGVIVFIVAWIIALIVRSIISRLSNHTMSRRYLFALLAKVAYVVIIIIGIITALGTMGINVLALVTGLGLASFAVGFALKDSLSNTLAGFIILYYEPFRIGDTIGVTNENGRVTEINLRYTVLQSEGKHIMVPNSTVLTNTVIVQD